MNHGRYFLMFLIIVFIKGISTQYNGWESIAYDTTPLRVKYKEAISDGDSSTGAI